jgi:hypothetical protein
MEVYQWVYDIVGNGWKWGFNQAKSLKLIQTHGSISI